MNRNLLKSNEIGSINDHVLRLSHLFTQSLVQLQGRSYAFESEGAQSPKAILGPFSLKKWEGPSLLLLLYGQKSGGAQAPQAPYIDYGPD